MIDWFMGRFRTIHFIGIGGIGMSGLAEILLKLGFFVQGSDLNQSEKTQRLSALGAKIFIGHQREHIGETDVVVYSSAVPMDNPELEAAAHSQVPIIRRAELLAELMRLKYGIAVAGTHGKTTTTSMIAHLLAHADLDPTVVVGGNANNIGTNARIGDGKYFVAEADESDESFLMLVPAIAVITNIEAEHLDHYKGLDHIVKTFGRFLSRIPFFGSAVVCGDDVNIRKLLVEYSRRAVTYGFDTHNDLWADELESNGLQQSFRLHRKKDDLGFFTQRIPGSHMVLNAMAALGVGLELNIGLEQLRTALAEFCGVKRRLEIKGEWNDILIIDDYAHHPTEIRATLQAIRRTWKRPVTAVFEPHRYTRTRYFLNEFADVLSTVDRLVLLPIYAASEPPDPDVSSKILMQQCRSRGLQDISLIENQNDVVDYLARELYPGDILVTLGAGSVFRVGENLIDHLSAG